jgi:S1-C subfamily serine protease
MAVTKEPPEDDSDHANFLAREVPTLFFFTGYHDDYHRPSDEVSKLSGPRLEAVARTVFALTLAVGDRDERLVFDPEVRPKHLGIIAGVALAERELSSLADYRDGGAIVVREVLPDSVAAHAGLRAGDLLVEIDDERLPKEGALEALGQILARVKRGTEVPLTLVRDGKVISAVATWPRAEPVDTEH